MKTYFKMLLACLSVALLSSCGKKSIDVIGKNYDGKIPNSSYINFVEDFTEKSLRKAKRVQKRLTKSKKAKFDIITIGLSLDARKGLLGWDLGSSTAMELHFTQR